MTGKQGGDAWREVQACRTLFQVHEALVRLRPAIGADPERWRLYRQRSAAAYEWIADIDRGHHHEALYWAGREREHANKITRSRVQLGAPVPGSPNQTDP